MTPHPDRPLLFLDYDGTLAPIVDDPAKATPHPDVPGLLARLTDQHPVVIVTGRDLASLSRLLTGVRVRAVGLHGAETGWSDGAVDARAAESFVDELARLRAEVPQLEGVLVEDKGTAFAVHYRHAPDAEAARAALETWARSVPDGLTAIWGKKVVELRAEDVSKGTAVAALAAEHPGRTPVYLGDDVTDEDAFEALHRLRQPGVTIKVGEGETVAAHRLPDPDAVVAYLRGFMD
ncbi:MAG: trehalose-phosphatase [Rubricoccaceae bacterium]